MALPQAIRSLFTPAPIAAESLIDELKVHLEFLGYDLDPKDAALFITQPGRFSWLLRDFNGGVLYRKIFSASEAGHAQLPDLYRLANAMNAEASLTRCYVDKDGDMVVEAWHANLYERRAFGRFINGLEADLRRQLDCCRADVELLLA